MIPLSWFELRYHFTRSLDNLISGRVLVNNYIISPPKAGRTWVRVFLGKYLSLVYQTKFRLDFTSWDLALNGIPRIIFSHGGFELTKMTKLRKIILGLQHKKIIFLVRDPRDIATSLFFHCKYKHLGHAHYWKTTHTFGESIRLPRSGISHIVDYLNNWLILAPKNPNFLIIRYVDLKNRRIGSFKKILGFLNLPYNDAFFREALFFSNLKNMRQLEKNNTLNDERLRPTNPADPDSYKVRRGKVNGYRDYFSKRDILYAAKEIRRLNPSLKYLP